jgi:nitrite reductase (NO-forming)
VKIWAQSTGGATLPEVKAILTTAPQVPPPVDRQGNARVIVNLEMTEVTATLADGVKYAIWTFGGSVPGPFVRVRVGDIVQINLASTCITAPRRACRCTSPTACTD